MIAEPTNPVEPVTEDVVARHHRHGTSDRWESGKCTDVNCDGKCADAPELPYAFEAYRFEIQEISDYVFPGVRPCKWSIRFIAELTQGAAAMSGTPELRGEDFVPMEEWLEAGERDQLMAYRLSVVDRIEVRVREHVASWGFTFDATAFKATLLQSWQQTEAEEFAKALGQPPAIPMEQMKQAQEEILQHGSDTVDVISLPLAVIRLLMMQVGRIKKEPAFARFVPEFTDANGTHFFTRGLEDGVELQVTTNYSAWRKATDRIGVIERELAPMLRRREELHRAMKDHDPVRDKFRHDAFWKDFVAKDAEVKALEAQKAEAERVVNTTEQTKTRFPAGLEGCIFEVL